VSSQTQFGPWTVDTFNFGSFKIILRVSTGIGNAETIRTNKKLSKKAAKMEFWGI